MARLAIAVALVAIAVLVAEVLRRRAPVDAPTQPRGVLPIQIDRADFPASQEPWLVAVFTSATCHSCANVLEKAKAVACHDVGVVDVEYNAERALHARYNIDSVPALVLADAQGVVRASFLGPVTATDLWAKIAEARA